MSDQAIIRITREIKQIERSADLSLAVEYDEGDIRNVRAIILGPPETPYQFGLFEYEQIVETLKHHKNYSLDLSLANDNPFLWKVTYFGRPTTPLEGGIIKIRIHLSPRFPEEQPRVFLETPLSHVRVSKARVLCYFPKKIEEMRHHIEAIVAALEEEPPYDPRATVNPEASKLFWGSPEDRKKYKRTLRRDVERSVEDAFE